MSSGSELLSEPAPPSRRSPPVLVLGAAGFLGSHLTTALLEAGWDVRAWGRRMPGLLPNWALQHEALEIMEGTLGDQESMHQALQGCETCIHLVSTTLPHDSNLRPIADVEENLIATLRFLQVAREHELRRLIFLSSGGTVYGVPREVPIREDHPTEPICSYGITKRAIELHLALEQRLHGLDQRVVRLANPYGEGQRALARQGAIAVFLGKALRGETIELWGNGETVRDFVHIDDATEAIRRLLAYTGKQTVFNIGSGEGHSIREILETIGRVTGRQLDLVQRPARSCDVASNVLCIERARQELGWEPTITLEDGIARFARHLEQLG